MEVVGTGEWEMRSIGTVALALSMFVAGRAAAESMSACEQTIQYTVAAPAADVPANIAAFSGVWVGDWSKQLCGVLIVESIAKDGTVNAKYVWGSNPGWGIAKPGFSQWTGKITNGALKLPPNRAGIYVDYTMKSPSDLAGVYNGRTPGTFTKR
jgi:hypothetical protein